MKFGIFDWSANVRDGVTTLQVKDFSGRQVASGQGATINEARENALATTVNGDAREHLRTVVLPAPPFD